MVMYLFVFRDEVVGPCHQPRLMTDRYGRLETHTGAFRGDVETEYRVCSSGIVRSHTRKYFCTSRLTARIDRLSGVFSSIHRNMKEGDS